MAKPTWSFKDVLSSVPRTEPPQGLVASVVKRLPQTLDSVARIAKRANDQVVIAEGEVERAKMALEQVKKDNAERQAAQESYLAKSELLLSEAHDELVQAQMTYIEESIAHGALERIGPLLSFLSAIQDKINGDGK